MCSYFLLFHNTFPNRQYCNWPFFIITFHRIRLSPRFQAFQCSEGMKLLEVSEKRLLEVLEKRLQRIAGIAEFLRIGGEKVEISRNLTEEKAKVSFIWDLGICGDTKEF